jgi:hypothetical protein
MECKARLRGLWRIISLKTIRNEESEPVAPGISIAADASPDYVPTDYSSEDFVSGAVIQVYASDHASDRNGASTSRSMKVTTTQFIENLH